MVFVAALGYYLVRALRRRADRKRLHMGIVSVGTEFMHNVPGPGRQWRRHARRLPAADLARRGRWSTCAMCAAISSAATR